MRDVFNQAQLVAPTDFTVVVAGESGTGKELVANAIHRLSQRSHATFVPVDCGSIPPTLIESELFGHEKGAFTGADCTRPGKFEAASGGTLFLDEASNLPSPVQTRLLRALQERQVWRVGGTKRIDVDIRVIAATNQDLRALVQTGNFRRDLYHRLNEFTITVPPLRERLGDIPLLAGRFLHLANRELEKSIGGLSEPALGWLEGYEWPGNVRELRNVIRRAALSAETYIEPRHLDVRNPSSGPAPVDLDAGRRADGLVPLKELVRRHTIQLERQILTEVLMRTNGNKAEAARILQIDYKTLHTKVKTYAISV